MSFLLFFIVAYHGLKLISIRVRRAVIPGSPMGSRRMLNVSIGMTSDSAIRLAMAPMKAPDTTVMIVLIPVTFCSAPKSPPHNHT